MGRPHPRVPMSGGLVPSSKGANVSSGAWMMVLAIGAGVGGARLRDLVAGPQHRDATGEGSERVAGVRARVGAHDPLLRDLDRSRHRRVAGVHRSNSSSTARPSPPATSSPSSPSRRWRTGSPSSCSCSRSWSWPRCTSTRAARSPRTARRRSRRRCDASRSTSAPCRGRHPPHRPSAGSCLTPRWRRKSRRDPHAGDGRGGAQSPG